MNSDTKSLSTASGNAVGHTPGPWTTRRMHWHYAVESPEGRVADIRYVGRSGGSLSANDANLIAAAPDLLAALKELVERCDGEEGVRADGSNIQTMQAHAALEKAEGR